MKCPKLSKSKKLQYVYADIWQDLEELGIKEVKHYVKSFPRVAGFNIAQYGSMRVYFDDVRELYTSAGISKFEQTRKRSSKNGIAGDWLISNERLWERYISDCGYVAAQFLRFYESKEA